METPCRAEWNCGRESSPYFIVFLPLSLRAGWLSLAAHAIDGGSKPRRFCDAEKHACITPCNIFCPTSKRLSAKSRHGETRHRDAVLSATCLMGARYHATKICRLAHSYVYLDVVRQSMGIIDNKERSHKPEARCLKTCTVNAGASSVARQKPLLACVRTCLCAKIKLGRWISTKAWCLLRYKVMLCALERWPRP